MRYLALVLIPLLALSFMVAADPLYKWVDAQGNVHYSDKPQPGAQKIKLPKAQTYTAPAVALPPKESQAKEGRRRMGGDQEAERAVSIVSPTEQQVIWNTTTVTVSVSLSPGLRDGEQLTVGLDGRTQTVTGTSATFNDVDRGQHTATATVTGPSGTISAQSVTFFIQRGTKKP